MATKTNPAQPTLPGIESALCRCGCGQYFMRATRGRKREFINPTHKKRYHRAKAKTLRTDGTVRLQPLGWLYLRTSSTETANHLWNQLNGSEQAVMRVLCDSGIPADELLAGLSGLFARGIKP